MLPSNPRRPAVTWTIAATGEVVAVHAVCTGAPLAEQPRSDRVAHVEESDAFVGVECRIAAPGRRTMLHALDQQTVGDLDLPGRGMVGALDRADESRVGRVGHVEDRQPRFPEVGRVEVPAVTGRIGWDDLHGQLENRFTADIVVADELDTVGGVARVPRRSSSRLRHEIGQIGQRLETEHAAGAAIGDPDQAVLVDEEIVGLRHGATLPAPR